jgi:two-component system response regulator AdeR
VTGWRRVSLGGTETVARPLVLVVEDDPAVAEVVAAYLERRGFRVAAAGERARAAEMLRSSPPVLLISDVKLRGGNGEDLAKLAFALDVPVLLISGEPQAIERFADGWPSFLAKPFRLANLGRKIDALLGG